MAAFYVLNTDASIGTSKAAIGVVLRQTSPRETVDGCRLHLKENPHVRHRDG